MDAYAKQLLTRSFTKTWGFGDSVSSAVGAIVGVAAHYFPQWGAQVSGDLWQIPIYALAATALFRLLFFAPYELWREQKARADALESEAEEKPRLVLQFDQIGTGDATGIPDREAMLVFLRVYNRGSVASVATDFGIVARQSDGSEVVAEGHHFLNTTFGGVVIGPDDLIYAKGANPIPAKGMIAGALTVSFPKGTVARKPLLVARCLDSMGDEVTGSYQMQNSTSGPMIYVPGVNYSPAKEQDASE